MSGESGIYQWTCPQCKEVLNAREGKPHPKICNACQKKAKHDNEQVKRSTSDNNLIVGLFSSVLLIAAMMMAAVHVLSGQPGERFKDDNAYGATANAVEDVSGRTLIPGIATCALIAAVVLMILQSSSTQNEIRALRKDLARRAGEEE